MLFFASGHMGRSCFFSQRPFGRSMFANGRVDASCCTAQHDHKPHRVDIHCYGPIGHCQPAAIWPLLASQRPSDRSVFNSFLRAAIRAALASLPSGHSAAPCLPTATWTLSVAQQGTTATHITSTASMTMQRLTPLSLLCF